MIPDDKDKPNRTRRVSEFVAGAVGLLVLLMSALYSWHSVEHTMTNLFITMAAAAAAAIIGGAVAYFLSFGIGSLVVKKKKGDTLDIEPGD
jgi:TRAP-type C4-dicarboxylate transport system permease small subunit